VDTALSPFWDEAQCVLVQPDGMLVVAGRIDGVPAGFDVLVARFESGGNLDPNFGNGGFASLDVPGSARILDLAIQPDGKLVMVGWVMDLPSLLMDKLVVRFNSDGTIDSFFGTDGVLILDDGSESDELDGVSIQSDGKIVVVGHGFDVDFGNNPTFFVGRLNPDGTFDSAFANGTGQFQQSIQAGSEANDVALMSDGSIVAAGGCFVLDTLNPWNSYQAGVVVRYMSDGALDASFGDEGLVLLDGSNEVDDVLGLDIQPDGKILLTGVTCEGCSTEWSKTQRLHTNGLRDIGFGTMGTVTHRSGMSPTRGSNVRVDGAGRSLIVGSYRPAVNENYSYLTRLLGDGTSDTAFGLSGELIYTDLGNGVGTPALAIQADGKIVLAGHHGQNVFLMRYLNISTGIVDPAGDVIQLLGADEFGAVLSSHISAIVQYHVIDMLGKVVCEGSVLMQPTDGRRVVFTSSLHRGVYVIVLKIGASRHAQRFVVPQ